MNAPIYTSFLALSESAKSVHYISDHPNMILEGEQRWMKYGFNTAAYMPPKEPGPICMMGKVYSKGIGTHAESSFSIYLGGMYDTFTADAGLQDHDGENGSVIFQVLANGQKLYESPVIRRGDKPVPVSVSVKGAHELQLHVKPAGKGLDGCIANWGDARLIPTPGAYESLQPVNRHLDIAPFAGVVTSDPARHDGARSSRLQDFRPEDIFLDEDVIPSRDGKWQVPVYPGGQGCIGLVWAERRYPTEVSITFSDDGDTPAPEQIKMEYWSSEGREEGIPTWEIVGQTVWQGRWEPLPGELTRTGNNYHFRIASDLPEYQYTRGGIHKVRWIISDSPSTASVESFSAVSKSEVREDKIRLYGHPSHPGETVTLELYNAYIAGTKATQLQWNTSEPLSLDLQSAGMPKFPDRGMIRFAFPTLAFAVAINDVVKTGCVYVPDAGLLAISDDSRITPAKYLASIEGKKSILERVREMPDQTFEQAKTHLLEPLNNNDPLLLSLACDNNKFVVERNGSILFNMEPDPSSPKTMLSYRYDRCSLHPKFGKDGEVITNRRIAGTQTPAAVVTAKDGNLTYKEVVFVPTYGEPKGDSEYLYTKPLGVARFTIENSGSIEQSASLGFSLIHKDPESQEETHIDFAVVEQGMAAWHDDKLVCFMDTSKLMGPNADFDGSSLSIHGDLPAGGCAEVTLYIPRWNAALDECLDMRDSQSLYDKMCRYWSTLLAGGMRIDVPEQLLCDVFHASPMHIMLATRNEDDASKVAPWVASASYGPIDSEAQAPTLAMDLLGYHGFTRRCHEYFLSKYNHEGYLANGYTVIGTGQHLWTLAQHYRLTGDAEWIKKFAPQLSKSCRWITTQRSKTMKHDSPGRTKPEHGLMSPGVLADWHRYAYYFYGNGFYYAGLSSVGEILKESGCEGAEDFSSNAEEYRNDIMNSFKWNQARMPVRPLSNGAWVPACPSSLYCFDYTRNFYGTTSAIGHDVELGGHHIINHGVIPACSKDADWVMNDLEDSWFLIYHSLSDYPEDMVREDWFNFGGFSKLQPYYTRTADVYLAMDDIKPFIRSCFNTFFPMLSMETLALWEHFKAWGGWNKTHETGWMLGQVRNMLLTERGSELWLAPFVTDNWLKDGLGITITNAPSNFGPVSYDIKSNINQGHMTVWINPPNRKEMSQIVIRLRHPEGKNILGAKATGGDVLAIDNDKQTVSLHPTGGTIDLTVEF